MCIFWRNTKGLFWKILAHGRSGEANAKEVICDPEMSTDRILKINGNSWESNKGPENTIIVLDGAAGMGHCCRMTPTKSGSQY